MVKPKIKKKSKKLKTKILQNCEENRPFVKLTKGCHTFGLKAAFSIGHLDSKHILIQV